MRRSDSPATARLSPPSGSHAHSTNRTLPNELQAAIVLLYSLLDEQERRLFAGVEFVATVLRFDRVPLLADASVLQVSPVPAADQLAMSVAGEVVERLEFATNGKVRGGAENVFAESELLRLCDPLSFNPQVLRERLLRHTIATLPELKGENNLYERPRLDYYLHR